MAVQLGSAYGTITIDARGVRAGVRDAQGALNSFQSSAQQILNFAVGQLVAVGFRSIIRSLADVAAGAVETAADIQILRIGLETLSAREAVLAGAFKTIDEAIGAVGPTAQALMEDLRELSLVSPFQYYQIADTFRLNMAFGATSESAMELTRATLNLGAGMGWTNEVLQRASWNLGQALIAGDLTTINLRQLRMVGLDLADVFQNQLGLSIEEVREQLQSGALTMEEVSRAFVDYVDQNFAGAAERMTRTFQGLRNNVRDLFTFAAADLLTPALETVTGALNDAFGAARRLVDSGVLRVIGTELGNIAQAAIDAGRSFISQFGAQMARAAENALAWGINISANLAAGIVQGAVDALVAAMNFVGDLLASWLGPGSPPAVAPEIDRWGAAAMTEFLEGFEDADWSTFDVLQTALEDALQALVSTGAMGRDALGPTMASMSQYLAEVIAEYRRTGQVGEEVFQRLTAVGGQFGSELADLARLQFELVDATKAYDEATAAFKRAQEAERQTTDEVERLSTAYEEAVATRAPLREVRARKAELDAAKARLAQAKAEREQAEQAVDTAKERMDLLREQVRMQGKLLEQLERIAVWQQQAAERAAGGGAAGRARVPRAPGAGASVGAPPRLAVPSWAPLEKAVEGLETSPFMERLRKLFEPVRKAWEEDIQPALQTLSETWQRFTGIVGWAWDTYVRPVVDELGTLIPPELLENIGWAAGVVLTLAAAFGVAAGVVGLLSTVIGSTAAVILAIIGAVGLLKTAWENDWGGIRTTTENAVAALKNFWDGRLLPAMRRVGSWIETNLVPIFNTVAGVLETVVVTALTVLAAAWEEILYPALQIVWGFIQENVIPLFLALADVAEAILGKAVEALAGLWQNVLHPALKAVWGIIQDDLIPIFERLMANIRENIGPVLRELGERILPPIRDAFDRIGGAIQGVIGWLRELAEKIRNLRLPDWLQPGSPTPFELGLRGIADAMRDISRLELPRLMVALSPAAAMLPAGPSWQMGTVTHNYGSRIQIFGGLSLYGVQDTQGLLRQLQELAQ